MSVQHAKRASIGPLPFSGMLLQALVPSPILALANVSVCMAGQYGAHHFSKSPGMQSPKLQRVDDQVNDLCPVDLCRCCATLV